MDVCGTRVGMAAAGRDRRATLFAYSYKCSSLNYLPQKSEETKTLGISMVGLRVKSQGNDPEDIFDMIHISTPYVSVFFYTYGTP